MIIEDMGLRFAGLIERQCLFNTIPPVLRAGFEPTPAMRQATDYFRRQGRDADGAGRRAAHARGAPPLRGPVLRFALLGRAGHV